MLAPENFAERNHRKRAKKILKNKVIFCKAFLLRGRVVAAVCDRRLCVVFQKATAVTDRRYN